MIQKFISKLSDKEKKILYLTVAAVVIAAMDRFFFDPMLSRLKSLDDDISTQETSIKRDLRFLAYKDRILQEKKLLNKYYVRKHQTEEEIIAVFLKRIEMLATDSQINLVRVTPTESEQKKGFVEYSANLECTGKLKDIVSFIHKVDSSPDLMKVTKYAMNAKKASSDEMASAMTVSKILVDAGPINPTDAAALSAEEAVASDAMLPEQPVPSAETPVDATPESSAPAASPPPPTQGTP